MSIMDWQDFSTMESQLDCFEMKFNENTSIRFSDFVGEEHEGRPLKTLFFVCGLDDHAKKIMRMKRAGLCSWFFDDGWFHLDINKSELDEAFINQIDFD